jgi:hypothetical protein
MLVTFGSGCSGGSDDIDTEDSSGTEEARTEEAAVTGLCTGAVRTPKATDPKPMWDNFTFTKYLYEPTYKLNIFGTKGVDGSFMKRSCLVLSNIMKAMQPSLRSKMEGYRAHFKVESDGGTGGSAAPGTILKIEYMCGPKAVGKDWETLPHEFGHSIELTLGLEAKSDKIFSAHSPYENKYAREYFAWASQRWFSDGRANMTAWEKDYTSTIYMASNSYVPSCKQ